jgi:hypothetical protein
MGLNISGLVIDKNYENNINELESILGQKLVFDKEVSFEDALENWKEDTYCDIYFAENGTFILLSMELGGFDFYAKNQIAYSFVLSEMTMMFAVNYTQNDQLLRSIMISDEGTEDEGEPFEFEDVEDEDKSTLIYDLIEHTLGESFDDIDLEATCYRYSFTDLKNNGAASNKVKNANDKTGKPWWRFW